MDTSIEECSGSLPFPSFLLAFVNAPPGVYTTTGVSSELINNHELVSRVAMQRALLPRAYDRTYERLFTNSFQWHPFHRRGVTTRISSGVWESGNRYKCIEEPQELLFSSILLGCVRRIGPNLSESAAKQCDKFCYDKIK